MASKGAVAACKAGANAGKAMGWREKLDKYKDQLAKGVWGYWQSGRWQPLALSARHRAKLRKQVLLAGEDWPYDPPRKEMKTVMKGHKCDRIAAQRRENTAQLMKQMPQILLDYKKRRWEKKMKGDEKKGDEKKMKGDEGKK